MINRIEYREYRVLIEVTTKEEVENTIIKENAARFRLDFALLILSYSIYKGLGQKSCKRNTWESRGTMQ